MYSGTMSLAPITLNLFDGIALGFFSMMLLAFILNKFGNTMYRWGIAKPFYVLGRRLHHKDFLLVILPLLYSVLAGLILAGYVQIVWSLLWTGIGASLIIAAVCLGVDMVLDYLSANGFRWGFFRHELIYLLIPAFAFSDFLRLAI